MSSLVPGFFCTSRSWGSWRISMHIPVSDSYICFPIWLWSISHNWQIDPNFLRAAGYSRFALKWYHIAFLGGQRGLWTPVIEGLNLINIHSFSTCWTPKTQWQAEILDHFGGRSFLVSTLRMPLSALALWQQPGETNWEMSKSCEKKSVVMKQKLMFPISYFFQAIVLSIGGRAIHKNVYAMCLFWSRWALTRQGLEEEQDRWNETKLGH